MITIDRPVRTAWSRYKAGARNMNVNSIGSVTPVRKEVSPSESSIPATALRRSGSAE